MPTTTIRYADVVTNGTGWSNPARILGAPNAQATSRNLADFSTADFVLSFADFSAEIPSGSTINRIDLQLTCRSSDGNRSVRFILDGQSSSDQAIPTSPSTFSLLTHSFINPSADVRNRTPLTIRVTASSSGQQSFFGVHLDSVGIVIDYTINKVIRSFVKRNGTWGAVDPIKVRQGGTWRDGRLYVRHAGTWKKVFGV